MLKRHHKSFFSGLVYILLPLAFLFASCNEHAHIGEKEIVEKPEDINVKAEEVIQGTLKDILQNNKDISDSFKLKNAAVLQLLYGEHSFQPLWSAEGKFNHWGDSLFTLIDSSVNYGLFPQDYYHQKLSDLKMELTLDTSKEVQLDAAKWAYSDLLLTSAFVQLVKDLSKGRLLPDSIMAKDSILTPEFYTNQFNLFKKTSVGEFTLQLEPTHTGTRILSKAFTNFCKRLILKNIR